MNRTTLASLLTLAAFVAACGGSEVTGEVTDPPADVNEAPDAGAPDEAAPPAMGMCLEGTVDCVDTVVTDDAATDDAIDESALITEAESMLGSTEEEALANFDEARLGRHGDDTFALIEDYRIGRKTIATEDDGTGTFRVVEVTLELTDGPVVLEAS